MGMVFCEVTPGSRVFVEGPAALVFLPAPCDLLEWVTGVSIPALLGKNNCLDNEK